MGKVKVLTDEQVQDRLNWLMHEGHREFWHMVWHDEEDNKLSLDEAGIDKLYEISKVAREVALYFTNQNQANSTQGETK